MQAKYGNRSGSNGTKGTYMFATEACEGYLPWNKGPYPGDWGRAETYAHDILGDLLSFAEGWTDWNAYLDESGGPNWADNQVDAAIIIDSNTSFFKQPMFYALAHFAKYVVPGSIRVELGSTSSVGHAPMEAGAFLRPDGLVAVVVLNRGLAISAETDYTVDVGGGRWVNMKVPPHSMQTILLAP